ncbi:hypothetical protein K493DRAFT_359287 [Basidiobolus meristosporus CBS 931.73]|uniref:Uncharacterized protein n=1 Tax=Basidiobolus meristosporus CBS 931.73 TaxID=1314790 RepID=A0A1Y1XS95_9FUNG|nr:hypothetical protein K493DRAFT_359287 [Basidiobolus meristosporus CBS 931.73]|eukprot:ORX88627.1 hypothetical protein K493DRAFT_359287 [Basidiobolus meristosporus CBS 931.73]
MWTSSPGTGLTIDPKSTGEQPFGINGAEDLARQLSQADRLRRYMQDSLELSKLYLAVSMARVSSKSSFRLAGGQPLYLGYYIRCDSPAPISRAGSIRSIFTLTDVPCTDMGYESDQWIESHLPHPTPPHPTDGTIHMIQSTREARSSIQANRISIDQHQDLDRSTPRGALLGVEVFGYQDGDNNAE